MSNPFFALQERIASLLRASPYFASLQEDQILTENIGDLTSKIETALMPLGFGVVVTTASGDADQSSYELLTSKEDLNISIIHNPTGDAAHNALDAQFEAMKAVHGQVVDPAKSWATMPADYFAVTGHQRRMDVPDYLHVREIHVSAGLRIS